MTNSLSEKQVRLLLLFKQAIQGEQSAQKLYQEMLDNCEDPELRLVIESFRAAESRHEAELLERYAALRQSEKFTA